MDTKDTYDTSSGKLPIGPDVRLSESTRSAGESQEDRLIQEEIRLITDSFYVAGLAQYTVQVVLDERRCSDALGSPAAVAIGVVVLPR